MIALCSAAGAASCNALSDRHPPLTPCLGARHDPRSTMEKRKGSEGNETVRGRPERMWRTWEESVRLAKDIPQ